MRNKLTTVTLVLLLAYSMFLPLARLNLIDPLYRYDWFELVFNESVFALVIMPFILFTYFAPDHIFQYWWKFARIGIPVAFILSLLINLEVHHSPGGQWEDIFDIPALILIYGAFTLGSIWQIWKGFRQR
jgi:hypothetical protein